MPVIRIVGSVKGEPTPWDGQWLIECDLSRDSVSPDGFVMRMHLVTTGNPALAKRFANLSELTDYYCRSDPREPFYPNGHPNRPLTYFTIEI